MAVHMSPIILWLRWSFIHGGAWAVESTGRPSGPREGGEFGEIIGEPGSLVRQPNETVLDRRRLSMQTHDLVAVQPLVQKGLRWRSCRMGRRTASRVPAPLWGRDRVGGRAMPSRSTPLARTLRRNATSAERRLWQGLRRKQVSDFRFRGQVVLKRLHRRLRLLRGANDRRPPDYDPGATAPRIRPTKRSLATSLAPPRFALRGSTFCASPTTTYSAISKACWRRSG